MKTCQAFTIFPLPIELNPDTAQDFLLQDIKKIDHRILLDPAFEDVAELDIPEAPEIGPRHYYRTSRLTGNEGPVRMKHMSSNEESMAMLH